MDPGFVRGVGTLVLLLAFVGLCVWAWSPGQRAGFQEAAELPLRDDEDLPGKDARGGGDDE